MQTSVLICQHLPVHVSLNRHFRGDYVKLRKNVFWKKYVNLNWDDRHVVFAAVVNKVNRSDGQVCGFKHRKCMLFASLRLAYSNYKRSALLVLDAFWCEVCTAWLKVCFNVCTNDGEGSKLICNA